MTESYWRSLYSQNNMKIQIEMSISLFKVTKNVLKKVLHFRTLLIRDYVLILY